MNVSLTSLILALATAILLGAWPNPLADFGSVNTPGSKSIRGGRVQVQAQSSTKKKPPPKKTTRPRKKGSGKPPATSKPAPKPAATPADAGSEDIDARRQELEKLKAQLERERKEAERIRGREKKVLAELETADRQLSSTRRYLKKLADQEKAINSRLGKLELDIAAREGEISQTRTRLGSRLREMYKTGDPGMVEVLFSSASIPDLIDRVRIMTLLADEETRLMQSIQQARTALHNDRQEISRRYAEVQQVELEKQREEKRIKGLKVERQGQAAGLKKERAKHEAAMKELQAAEKSLAALIRRLETQRRTEPDFVSPSGPFAGARGRLPWPARGTVIEGYGTHTHPKFGTSTENKGIDIGAASGAAVRAVADGKVDYSDWLTGYGNCVILNHGGGYYTLYAHLASVSVSVGQQVGGGAIIGTVGDTGSLKGTLLHFEVRQGARAMDPESWLGG
jgi:murein hydrolase activator